MSKLLCIAIPTYNRAEALDRQLRWLRQSMSGHEDDCQVIISDNSSADSTPVVAGRWRDAFEDRGVSTLVLRNPRNIGPLRNIQQCIERSSARFTWVVGDDDLIDPLALPWVLATLRRDPDLASVLMNFHTSGERTLERAYAFAHDVRDDGRRVMLRCLRERAWGLAFMTAHVYRTEFARAAYRLWPEGAANYDYQMFITLAVGLRGRVHATERVWMTYVTGENIYRRDPEVGMRMMADTLEVLLRMGQFGIPAPVVRRIAVQHLRGVVHPVGRHLLQAHPRTTATTVLRALHYASRIAAASGRPRARRAWAWARARSAQILRRGMRRRSSSRHRA